MDVWESVAAVAFYVGLLGLCAGGVLTARGAVEKKRTTLAIPFAVLGTIALVLAIVAYTHGPRKLLPF